MDSALGAGRRDFGRWIVQSRVLARTPAWCITVRAMAGESVTVHIQRAERPEFAVCGEPFRPVATGAHAVLCQECSNALRRANLDGSTVPVHPN